MYKDLFGMLKPGDIRWRTYWFYLQALPRAAVSPLTP